MSAPQTDIYLDQLAAGLAGATKRQVEEAEESYLEPNHDRIVLRVLDPEDRSPGGIILPSLAIENSPYRFGIIEAAGQGRMTATGDIVPMRWKRGDVVMFARVQNNEQFALPALDGSSKNWFVIRDPHIIGRITNPKRISHLVDGGGSALSMPGDRQ